MKSVRLTPTQLSQKIQKTKEDEGLDKENDGEEDDEEDEENYDKLLKEKNEEEEDISPMDLIR